MAGKARFLALRHTKYERFQVLTDFYTTLKRDKMPLTYQIQN